MGSRFVINLPLCISFLLSAFSHSNNIRIFSNAFVCFISLYLSNFQFLKKGARGKQEQTSKVFFCFKRISTTSNNSIFWYKTSPTKSAFQHEKGYILENEPSTISSIPLVRQDFPLVRQRQDPNFFFSIHTFYQNENSHPFTFLFYHFPNLCEFFAFLVFWTFISTIRSNKTINGRQQFYLTYEYAHVGQDKQLIAVTRILSRNRLKNDFETFSSFYTNQITV